MRLGLLVAMLGAPLPIACADAALAAEPGRCATLVPPAVSAPIAPRTITPRDLAGLRDLGYSGDTTTSPFSISPDGSRIAFQLRRADPDGNDYCQAMLVLDLAGRRAPIVVDSGGELVRMTFARQSQAALGTGYPAAIVPHWSPDGRSIAFLKNEGARTQVWVAIADGSGSQPVTRSPNDIEDLAWLPDGRNLVVATRPGLDEGERAIDREGLGGYHYDARFTPMAGARPAVAMPVERRYPVVDTRTGEARAAVGGEQAALSTEGGKRPAGAILFAQAGLDGDTAWTAPRDPNRYISPAALHVRVDGRERVCADPACVGTFMGTFKGLWWSGDGRELRFLRREGWAGSQLAFYRWSPRTGRPRRVWVTDDLLFGCQPLGRDFLCAEEKSTEPRRLVRVDPETGRRCLLFDPNPEFAALRLGSVQRLTWRNAFGIESFGDLVLPPDHVAGQHHPLVVVQYRSRGFLRGGTGDEFPIQPLAARGFAVLSIERPEDIALRSDARDDIAFNRADLSNWADRRSVLSSIGTGVRLAVDRGVADPARVGITGLSDGASTAQFALINSRMFAAAAIATCCEDPQTVMTMSGPDLAAAMHDWGYPLLSRPQPEFWKPYSLAVNADRITTPILMLSADREYLPALEPFTALREQGQPVDLYVFPDEYHVLWQPAHRLAAYERVLDWFDFWLRGREDPDPTRGDQYAYWRRLRDGRRKAPGSAAPADR